MSSSSPVPPPAKSESRPTPRARRSRRWIPWLGAVVFVALLGYGFRPKPAPVETVPIASGNLRSSIDEEGKTRIRNRYRVSAPVAGHLRRIPMKAGDMIASTNQPVAFLDPISPAPLDARNRTLSQARRDATGAQLERARAQHRFAAADLKRGESLFAQKTISPQELEQFQWRETAAARELSAAEAALRQAEAELLEYGGSKSIAGGQPTEVFPPVAGKVLKVFEESERIVGAGTPLLEIGDPGDLEVVIETLSRDAATLKPGTPVELEHWGGSKPLQAVVRLVEPAAFTKVSALGVEEQRVNVIADIVTPLSERGNLGDQFRVEARIVTWQKADSVKIPSGAVFRRGDKWFAYFLSGGRAQMREVKVGRSSGVEMEVLDGAKPGEEVILYPGDRIRDGLAVQRVTL